MVSQRTRCAKHATTTNIILSYFYFVFTMVVLAATSTTNTIDGSTLDDLLARVRILEEKAHGLTDSSSTTQIEGVDENMRRARTATFQLYSARWKWVPSNYYEQSLESRAKILNDSPVSSLCKSLVMENRKLSGACSRFRFVLIVIPYAAALDTQKLSQVIRSQYSNVKERPTQFDWRIADEVDNARLTGYSHNAVTPFGVLEQASLPIVLAETIVTSNKFMWMGGGHIHLKLGCSVSEFRSVLQPIVGDVSNPRTSLDDSTME